MKINNSNELYKIINEIHDMWFDIEQVKNSHIEGSITIGLTRKSSNLEEKKVEKTLRINNVIKIDINDTEKVDYYDVNEILYNNDGNEIEISTGVPIEIKIIVDSFEIELEQ